MSNFILFEATQSLRNIYLQNPRSTELKFGGFVMPRMRTLCMGLFTQGLFTGKIGNIREKNQGERVVKELTVHSKAVAEILLWIIILLLYLLLNTYYHGN